MPHSHVHNERTVPMIMAGCMAHARNGHNSTSGLKSDVTIVFLDPDFLRRDNFGDSRIFKANIGLLKICMGFRISWPKMGVLGEGKGGKIGEGVVRY